MVILTFYFLKWCFFRVILGTVFPVFTVCGIGSNEKWKSLSYVQLFATPWTVACQAPVSMGCSRQEYWSGLPCPPPGDLTNPGIELRSTALQILYQMSHKGSPRILEWVAYPFSSESSQPRNWAGVSWIAGRFFTSWATRESQPKYLLPRKLSNIYKVIFLLMKLLLQMAS